MAESVYEYKPEAASAPLPTAYRRREPEKTVLYQLVADELATFRARAQEMADGAGLPRFVLSEFERYLSCGILALGFVRIKCRDCHDEMLVAFSCKGRGVCPSCGARRMHDSAAHLVDRVFPFIPVRQWVISWPKWLRPYLARHPALASSAQKIFLRSVFAWQRRKAKAHGFTDVRTGSVYFSQRAGDSLNLNPHVHAILPDGVFEKTAEQAVAFQKLEKPNDEDVLAILTRIVKRTRRYLELRGILQDAPAADALDELAFSTQCSTRRPPTERRRAPLSAFLEGFSLHAGTHVHENDRPGLEHVVKVREAALCM